MRKIASYVVTFLLANVLTVAAIAQITISGNVRNSATKEGAGAVSVSVKGTSTGTFTDDKGNFKVVVKSLPVTLFVSSVGYELQEITVSSAGFTQVEFKPSAALGQEVVVSATRVPQKIMESPVSIERVSAANIRNAPAANFYDIVATLKGVDITTSSLTFKTPTTRGFGGSGNVRFNQLVDGMDNQAPGLNFSVGAIIGLNELDIDNIELLSGASSALYGPGGMNGTMLMTSKNPFKYQGLSFVVKTGVMHTDKKERPTSPYYNWSLRWAKKISEKFAFKITTELVAAKDWIGTDYRNYDRAKAVMASGNRQTDPNYDGVNVYGDETSVDIRAVFSSIAGSLPGAANFINANGLLASPQNVSRTGYTEQELINPNTLNYKLGGSLHYKISNNTEAIIAAYWGTGNTIYTGASRYSIKDFKMGQYKVELLNKNWMLRAYTTQENAGETFNLGATTQNFNETWKPSTTWYPQYAFTYLSSRMNGMTDYDAHQSARVVADAGRPAVNSTAFKNSYDVVRKLPVPQGGGLLDRSDLYSIEGNYNLSPYTKKFADILVGANYRSYSLNSQGTLFADKIGDPISINEFGAFVQATREISSNLNISASGRYDKNENFKGRITPRVTAVYKVAPNNNIRLSYQTAYRFPSTQQQWIDLDLLSYKLIGGNKFFIDKYNFNTNPVYELDPLIAGNPTLKQWNYPAQKPEALSSFELGYKGLLMDSKLLIDAYGYYGNYTDFTGRIRVVQAKNNVAITPANYKTGQIYSVPINYTNKINTNGFGLGLDYRLPRNFSIAMNLASDNLDIPSGLIASFNSPKYKLNANISNSGFGKDKRLGFNVAYRWQDEFYFDGDLASGTLPAVQTVDAQFSFKLPSTKSILKLGANNLLNQYYYNGVGNSNIGGLYYVSFGYNIY